MSSPTRVRWITQIEVTAFRRVMVDMHDALTPRGIEVEIELADRWVGGDRKVEGDLEIALTVLPPWSTAERMSPGRRAWIVQFLDQADPMEAIGTPIEYLCLTRFAQQELSKRSLQTSYLPHGYDATIFFPGDKDSAREDYGLPRHAPVISFVGVSSSAFDRKGVGEALEAVYRYREGSGRDATLVLRTDRDGLITIPDEPWIKVVGPRLATGIATLMQASDVFLFPTKKESFGLPIIEAQACGTPVVTTAVEGVPELVENGTAVSTIPSSATIDGSTIEFEAPNVDELAEAIGYWIEESSIQ